MISDKTGKETLEVIGEANRFNKWMFQTISPYCKGNVLEVGSGLGNISTYFLEANFNIMLTDLRSEYCNFLKSEFKQKESLLGVTQLDLVHSDFDGVYKEHLEKYDTVFALNVIEHIEADSAAIKNAQKLLKADGHLIILVPSYQKLYNSFDRELGHFRRYTKNTLSVLFTRNGFKIIHQQYFNFMGIFGWYFSGKILKKSSIPSSQMKLYDLMVPVWKKLDQLLLNKVGLSTVIVGKKIHP